MPASSSRRWPAPETLGSGSAMAKWTAATPASMSAPVQGGVRPWWEQGSRVTYTVAPRARAPASASASTSAWLPPGGWVWPAPTIAPSRTTTAPTAGFGDVQPRALRACTSAAAMCSEVGVTWSPQTGRIPRNSPEGRRARAALARPWRHDSSTSRPRAARRPTPATCRLGSSTGGGASSHPPDHECAGPEPALSIAWASAGTTTARPALVNRSERFAKRERHPGDARR